MRNINTDFANPCFSLSLFLFLYFIQISRGPIYRLILKATANKPILEFSFNYYDFGPCYIRNITAVPYYVDLRITNSDDVPYM